MSEKGVLAFKNTVPVDEAAKFLELIAKSLKKGSLLMESGDQSLGVQFGPEMRVRLEAAQDAKDGKGSLELELKWEAGEENGATPTLELVPGGVAPAADVEEEED